MIPSWVERYVGLPWRDHGRDCGGVDCYGLVRIVYRDQFHVELPTYAGHYVEPAEMREVAQVLTGALAGGPWHRVEDPKPGDGIVLRLLGHPWHVGVVVAPGFFLHIVDAQMCSTVERWADAKWARRVEGFYRHEALA